MKWLLTLTKVNISDFYNFTQTTNNSDYTIKTIIIILLIVGISLYAILYIPIKLYQINRNTKLIKEELESINKNICKLRNDSTEIIKLNEI